MLVSSAYCCHMTETTLGQLAEGDEVLRIATTPASIVTTGIPWPTDGSVQRLFVRSAKVYGKGKAATSVILFTNGGFLKPCAANTPCAKA